MRPFRKHLTLWTLLLGAGIFLVAGILSVAGFQAVYLNHVIATFKISGLDSERDAKELGAAFLEFSGVRSSSVSRGPGTDADWMARVQFKAANPEAGGNQILSWITTMAPAHTLKLIKATYYPCRISRPRSGDIVMGSVRPIRLPAPAEAGLE